MHKVINLILVNLLLIFIVLFSCEIICFFKYYHFAKTAIITNKQFLSQDTNKPSPNVKDIFISKYIKTIFLQPSDFRKPIGLEYNKNNKVSSPIIISGCSFTYGYGLKSTESFQFFLSEQTKRPVYNLGVIGGGLREALYILLTPNIRSKLLKDDNHIKYFIYTYIPSHKKRLYANYRMHVPNFKYDDSFSSLTYYQDYLNNKTCFIPELMHLYANYFIDNDKAFKLIKLYFKKINSIINKNFNNYNEKTKLVIFIYGDEDNFNWDELKKDGIIIIKLKDISDINFQTEEYTISDNIHPNAKAWEVIVPALVKELKL